MNFFMTNIRIHNNGTAIVDVAATADTQEQQADIKVSITLPKQAIINKTIKEIESIAAARALDVIK